MVESEGHRSRIEGLEDLGRQAVGRDRDTDRAVDLLNRLVRRDLRTGLTSILVIIRRRRDFDRVPKPE